MHYLRAGIALLALSLAISSVPAYALAAASSTPAGFAPSLWLSASSITHGDTVKIYTAVYDATPEPIEGTVVFLVDGAAVGSAPFSLAAGGNAVVSAAWKATAGTHALSARIDGPVSRTSKQPVALADAAVPIRIMVAEAPPPSPAAAAAGAAIGAASDAVNAAAPVALSFGQSLLSGTESLREAGEAYFAAKLGDDAAARAGTVLGTTTQKSAETARSSLEPVYRAFLSVFASPALFYLALLLLLLFGFWLIRRRFGSANA